MIIKVHYTRKNPMAASARAQQKLSMSSGPFVMIPLQRALKDLHRAGIDLHKDVGISPNIASGIWTQADPQEVKALLEGKGFEVDLEEV